MKVFLLLTLLTQPVFAATSHPPSKLSEAETDNFVIEGSIHALVNKSKEQINIPGFISNKPLPDIATITGPVRAFNFIVGDRVYLRWDGAPPPRVGDYYALYSDALVLQSSRDNLDYKVVSAKGSFDPEKFRIAGYLFEPNGEVKVTSIGKGFVVAVITQSMKQIVLGDKLMLPMPIYENIAPITSGTPVTASIVLGSPAERMSPSLGAFVYINRGSRDGVRMGQIFEATEEATLIDSPAITPTEVMGELKVVYTAENFSTALVTKQHNVLKLGGTVQSKVGGQSRGSPSEKVLKPRVTGVYGKFGSTASRQKSFTPSEGPKQPPLSELDELERRAQIMGLTPDERSRLESLHAQDIRKLQEGETRPSPDGDTNPVEPDDIPGLPAAPKGETNVKSSKAKPKKKEKKKTSKDEENLNQLMQF